MMNESKSAETANIVATVKRVAWKKPVVRSIRAGEAEAFGGGADDGGPAGVNLS